VNLYAIAWVHDESFGLNAVVAAESEADALDEIALDPHYNSPIRVSLLGTATIGTQRHVVCHESL
jgi:hypothetical protein